MNWTLKMKSTNEKERGEGKSGVCARLVHVGGAIWHDVFRVRRRKTGCRQAMLLLLSWWMCIWVEVDGTWLVMDFSESLWCLRFRVIALGNKVREEE